MTKKSEENNNRIKCNELIREGNLYYNRQEYERSAEKYERAGKWAISHSLSNETIKEAFWLATVSWISACKIENVFRLLEKETFNGKDEILKESYKMINEILVDVKQMINNNNFPVRERRIQMFERPFSGKDLLKIMRKDLQRKDS